MIRPVTAVLAVALALWAVPTRAQLVVVDPGNLSEAILIAQRTQAHLTELQNQFATIL